MKNKLPEGPPRTGQTTMLMDGVGHQLTWALGRLYLPFSNISLIVFSVICIASTPAGVPQ